MESAIVFREGLYLFSYFVLSSVTVIIIKMYEILVDYVVNGVYKKHMHAAFHSILKSG